MTGCYGRTVNGTPCELVEGHYPATHHRLTFEGTSFMAWTDEGMAEAERIANDPGFPKQVEQQRLRYEQRQRRIAEVRAAIEAEMKRQADQNGDHFQQINTETWSIDAAINLHVLAMAVVDA